MSPPTAIYVRDRGKENRRVLLGLAALLAVLGGLIWIFLPRTVHAATITSTHHDPKPGAVTVTTTIEVSGATEVTVSGGTVILSGKSLRITP